MDRRGFRALAVFPIRSQDRVHGTLIVYADEAGYFQDKEVALLTEAAGDISFGLDNFVRNDARVIAAYLGVEDVEVAKVEQEVGV